MRWLRHSRLRGDEDHEDGIGPELHCRRLCNLTFQPPFYNIFIPPTGTRAPPSEMATHLQQQTRNRRK